MAIVVVDSISRRHNHFMKLIDLVMELLRVFWIIDVVLTALLRRLITLIQPGNVNIAARRRAARRKIISPTTNPIRIPLFPQAKQQQKMIIPRFSSISRKALQCECLSHSGSIQSSISISLAALCFEFSFSADRSKIK